MHCIDDKNDDYVYYASLDYAQSKIIEIDSEYSMITTKLEIILSFGIFCPLLYPVIIISINSFIYFYQTSIQRLGWKIKFLNHQSGLKSFPFHFLWIGILVQQFLTFLFFKTDPLILYTNNKDIISWILLTAYIIMDICFIYKTYKRKK